MSLVVHPLNLADSQLCIALRSRKPLVAQHLLNGAKIRALLQHMRPKRVAKRMWMNVRRQSPA